MPGGHASHKGSSVKPNTNTNGSIDMTSDLEVDPQDLLAEGMDARRAETEKMDNPQATERPSTQQENSK